MTTLLRKDLLHRNNFHTTSTRSWEAISGIGWHAATPSDCWLAGARSLSIVMPAFEVGYCLRTVLNALEEQHHRHVFEVIVVDDCSGDDTLAIATEHAVVTRVVRLPQQLGAATARNVGTYLARGDTVLYLDADMVLPPHVITDVAARSSDTTVLVGFRHGLPYDVHQGGANILARHPNLGADHRVVWHPPVGKPLLYSGITLSEPLDGRPLDCTRDFVQLGYGRRYYDWDLPRMVVTALLAVPRAAVLNVGGFDPEFGRIGWGMEDTYLGACLIAAGLLIIPLRQAVGFHLDPPDANDQWRRKLASWQLTLERYRALLDEPAPTGRSDSFTTSTNALLSSCEVLR